MNFMNTWGKAGVVALSVVALGTAVAAAQSKDDAVKARQTAMKSFGADTKAISDYIKGAGDKDSAAKAAMDMSATSTKLAKLWPAGTSSTDMPGVSKAKPDAFTDGAKFTDRFAALSGDASKLADTIKSGSTDDVKAAQGALAKANCGGCHMMYREAEQH